VDNWQEPHHTQLEEIAELSRFIKGLVNLRPPTRANKREQVTSRSRSCVRARVWACVRARVWACVRARMPAS
jgi:hypothetical protein